MQCNYISIFSLIIRAFTSWSLFVYILLHVTNIKINKGVHLAVKLFVLTSSIVGIYFVQFYKTKWDKYYNIDKNCLSYFDMFIHVFPLIYILLFDNTCLKLKRNELIYFIYYTLAYTMIYVSVINPKHVYHVVPLSYVTLISIPTCIYLILTGLYMYLC